MLSYWRWREPKSRCTCTLCRCVYGLTFPSFLAAPISNLRTVRSFFSSFILFLQRRRQLTRCMDHRSVRQAITQYGVPLHTQHAQRLLSLPSQPRLAPHYCYRISKCTICSAVAPAFSRIVTGFPPSRLVRLVQPVGIRRKPVALACRRQNF
jgi:hypothetical protein